MADEKISALTELTTPADEDLLATVDDPAGIPATKKITLANFKKSVYADTRFKVGSFQRDQATASGTQAVTGVGFSPKAVIFFAAQADAVGKMSVGLDDGATPVQIADRNNIGAGTWSALDPVSINIFESGSNIYSGKIQSLDADGFTITWTRTGSPTGTLTIHYLAFR